MIFRGLFIQARKSVGILRQPCMLKIQLKYSLLIINKIRNLLLTQDQDHQAEIVQKVLPQTISLVKIKHSEYYYTALFITNKANLSCVNPPLDLQIFIAGS
jgi:hypothetical protein